MRNACEQALRTAYRQGAEYADVRATIARHRVVEGSSDSGVRLRDAETRAIVIRASVDGAWGIATTTDTHTEAVVECATIAVANAYASALIQPGELNLSARGPNVATFETDIDEDPFAVTAADWAHLAHLALRSTSVRGLITRVQAQIAAVRSDVNFMSSEGDDILQTLFRSGGLGRVFASNSERIQQITSPQGPGGYAAAGGMEIIRSLGLATRIEEAALEAELQLMADPCPTGVSTLVLGTRQVSSQLRHTYGAALNADHLLARPPGTLPFGAERLGTSVAAPLVTVVADSGQHNGLGSFAYDDEGSEAREFDLVTDGTLTGWIASRMAAPVLGWTGPTCARADALHAAPSTATPNLSLCPRNGSLEDIISGVESGILMDAPWAHTTSKDYVEHWFTCEQAWRIEGGQIADRLYAPSYVGTTESLWSAVDAIGQARSFEVWAHVALDSADSMLAGSSHGSAPVRMQGIDVAYAGTD